ncbi:pX [bottlenose dolphin adenovirus 2]|nr:pX [Bottlenose dolphin adenovirus 1]ALE15302.1 pX [Bottlenose dolphin adenovirus 1]
MAANYVTCRVRCPVLTRRRRNGRMRKRSRINIRKRPLKGGFLQALIPLIAAAIGAAPGIASVAIQASQNRRH